MKLTDNEKKRIIACIENGTSLSKTDLIKLFAANSEKLTDDEKKRIIDCIVNEISLPRTDLFKLFTAYSDDEICLLWQNRKDAPERVVLPFHSIEHIDEPRTERGDASEQPYMFEVDERGRQLKGWSNKLIWGDNKLILSALAHGPLRDEIERAGGLKLIYIDPPFAVGSDFGFNINLAGETIEKQQNAIEEIAYRDTWGKGISSYLNMMYSRLKLMHGLLAPNGSIYVHCDSKVNHFLKILCNEVFGTENFKNEIAWCYKKWTNDIRSFQKNKDTILYYTKSSDYLFNKPEDSNAVGKHYEKGYHDNTIKQGTKRIKQLIVYDKDKAKNKIDSGLYDKVVHREGRTTVGLNDWWEISHLNSQAKERLKYPTQKPETLLERIIQASSNEGDLVADFFCGSGTTAAVAEKLGRKWIAADLGRFAIHTTRKRMINTQRNLKKNSTPYRSFEVLNLGKYERQFFMSDRFNQSTHELTNKEELYVQLILEAYKAQAVHGNTTLHGKKDNRFVHIGPLEVPVTELALEEIICECENNHYTNVDVLGFEFEMGIGEKQNEAKRRGIDVKLKYIPKDVFDEEAVKREQVKFYDISYVKASVVIDKTNKRHLKVKLDQFITYYTQNHLTEEYLTELEGRMKTGRKIIIANGKVIELIKNKTGGIEERILTHHWSDWVDYWAVDFNYGNKKEIIKIKNETTERCEEKWTGGYIFENEWQTFRTHHQKQLELESTYHTYAKPGLYTIMVKVVDILGIDASCILKTTIE